MMSSSVGTRGNPRGGGGREKSAKANQQNQHHQAKSSTGGGSSDHTPHVGKKATPDQMRMAQIYSDGTNEDTTKEKIRQVQDVVPKSEDEVLVALHDSNYDTEKAIMLLLERGEEDQQGEWETISSKKSKHRSGNVSSGGGGGGFRNNSSDILGNSKDSNSNGPDKDGSGGGGGRDRRGNKDREGGEGKSGGFKDTGFGTFGSGGGGGSGGGRDGDSGRERGGFGGRGRGRNNRGQLPPRMTRGRGGQSDSTSREREKNERNRWDGGESGRGRGRRGGYDNMNGPSRRGRGPRSFTNSKFGGGIEDDAFKPGDNVWTNPPAEKESNTWDNSMVKEDWGGEDWSGDDAALNGGRSETLPSTGGVGQPNWMTALTESKVFMASSTPPTTAPITLDSIESSPMPALSSSVAINAPVSMSPGSNLVTSNVSLAPSMPPQSSMPEMSHGRINLAELFAKPTTQQVNSHKPLGGVPGGLASNGMGGLGVSVGGLGSAGAIGSSPSGMGSSSIADLSQRQTSTSVFSAYVDLKPPVSESKTVGQQLGVSEPPSATVPAAQLSVNQQPQQQQRVPQQQTQQQTTQQQQQQQQQQQAAKPSRKRLPPPSTKIPESAVEMPGGPVPARGLGVLDVQFGAMDLNMEPSLPDFEVGSISSSNVGGGPATSMSSDMTLSLSDAYSVSEPTSTVGHLSYTTKVSDSPYPAQTINNALMSNSTTATTITSGLDRSVYAPGAQTRQMTPDPIPLPTQDLKSPYMQQQQQQQTQKPLQQSSIDTKLDQQQLQQQASTLSNLPSHSTAMSSLTSHPSSLAASSMALSSSGLQQSAGGGLHHSQMGLSSHAPSHQSRQIPNSYHGPTSASGSINVGGYGSSAQTASVTLPSSAYSSVHSNLGGAGTHSSAGLSSSSLTASGLPSGPSSMMSTTGNGLATGVVQSGSLPGSGLSAGAQLAAASQLSQSSQLSAGAPLSSGGVQLSNSSQLASGNVQLSNSGHHPSGGLNSASISSNNTHSTHTSVQTSPMTQGKMSGSTLDNRIHHQGSSQVPYDVAYQIKHVLDHSGHQSLTNNLGSSHPATTSYGSSTAAAAASLGFTSSTIAGSTSTTTTASTPGMRATTTVASNSKVPNLPPGMSFVPPNQQYIMSHGMPLVNAFAPHQAFYNYEEFQLQLSRMPGAAAAMGYGYDLQQFQQPATTLPGARDVSSLSTSPYSVTEANKFTRGDASSPVGASSLSAQQQNQQPGQQHATPGSHHTQQQQQQPTLFNAAAAGTIPPGYGYAGGLPYYQPGHGHAGMLPPGLQYPPPAGAVFPAVSTQVQQPNNRSQPATTLHSGFQQSAYGSHGAAAYGYDDLTQTQDFTKGGYAGVSQTQKTNTGATVAGTSAATGSGVGAADLSGPSSYSTKTHTPSFPDKQSFHGTPPPFSFPLASGNQAGPLNPAANAYPQHPFVPMMPHHNAAAAAAAILPQQLHGGDSHVGSSQRASQGTSGPAKQSTKQSYGSTYWSAN